MPPKAPTTESDQRKRARSIMPSPRGLSRGLSKMKPNMTRWSSSPRLDSPRDHHSDSSSRPSSPAALSVDLPEPQRLPAPSISVIDDVKDVGGAATDKVGMGLKSVSRAGRTAFSRVGGALSSAKPSAVVSGAKKRLYKSIQSKARAPPPSPLTRAIAPPPARVPTHPPPPVAGWEGARVSVHEEAQVHAHPRPRHALAPPMLHPRARR